MELIQSWKDSLSILKPQNLKPFLMVTAKVVLDFYRKINKPFAPYGNWTLIGVFVFLIGLSNFLKMYDLFFVEAAVSNAIFHCMIFLFCLGMRASVDIKNWDYFYSYLVRFWWLFVLTIVLGISHVYSIPFLFLTYVFFLFFVFDSHGTPRELNIALRNSILMLVYNLPLCVVLAGVLGVLNVVLYYLASFALGYFGGLAGAAFFDLIFAPLEVALISNMYIKLVHSQSTLYFKQPE